MVLVVAATPFEMEAFDKVYAGKRKVIRLVSGIGPVESAVRLTARLSALEKEPQVVINFGIAGAYLREEGEEQASLLDCCLAREEVLGDLGICLADSIEMLGTETMPVPTEIMLDPSFLARAEGILRKHDLASRTGRFVTVSCVSGTRKRGTTLARQHNGLCENMEGAAVARACQQFNLPCLEIRCISNLVEDRDISTWRLEDACRRAGQAAALIVEHLELRYD